MRLHKSHGKRKEGRRTSTNDLIMRRGKGSSRSLFSFEEASTEGGNRCLTRRGKGTACLPPCFAFFALWPFFTIREQAKKLEKREFAPPTEKEGRRKKVAGNGHGFFLSFSSSPSMIESPRKHQPFFSIPPFPPLFLFPFFHGFGQS